MNTLTPQNIDHVRRQATLNVLDGEGESRTTTEIQIRKECYSCAEPAHFKYTYLLRNARNNPRSSAFCKDDCSWCEDEKIFVCRECPEPPAPFGYEHCSIFPAIKKFAHMFLFWQNVTPVSSPSTKSTAAEKKQ